MATTPTTPTTSTTPGTPAKPEPAVGPAPKAPTPLDPPVVYYNTIWRVPPLVVDTKEQADALDPNEWTTGAAAGGTGAGQGPGAGQSDKPQWPQLYYNVNLEPKIVNDAKEAKALGEEWRQFNVPESLIKSAQATIDAAQKKAAAPPAAPPKK